MATLLANQIKNISCSDKGSATYKITWNGKLSLRLGN